MPAKKKHSTRPSGKPIPVRFTSEVLENIDAIGESYGLSRSDVIRLSCQAGLIALQKLGKKALLERIAQEIINDEVKASPIYTLPFLGAVAAGQPIEAPRNNETISVPKAYPLGHYVVEVNGASMEPDLHDGDRLLIEGSTTARPKLSPKNGKICVVSDGTGSLIKLFDRKRGFVSLNPAYPDVVPTDELRLQGYYVETL
jgi:SOS-response transcriptional repressor LexA